MQDMRIPDPNHPDDPYDENPHRLIRQAEIRARNKSLARGDRILAKVVEKLEVAGDKRQVA